MFRDSLMLCPYDAYVDDACEWQGRRLPGGTYTSRVDNDTLTSIGRL